MKTDEVIRCKNCKWFDRFPDTPYGYCNAAKHCVCSTRWDINIYIRRKEDFFCADAELEGDDE